MQKLHFAIGFLCCAAILMSGCSGEEVPNCTQAVSHAVIKKPHEGVQKQSVQDVVWFDTLREELQQEGEGLLIGHQWVSTGKRSEIQAEGVTLLIDSGAVATDVEISVVAVGMERSGAIPEGMANVTAKEWVYRMLPDGQQFEKDITIAISYDSTSLPVGYTAPFRAC